jgi:hypothetical protein
MLFNVEIISNYDDRMNALSRLSSRTSTKIAELSHKYYNTYGIKIYDCGRANKVRELGIKQKVKKEKKKTKFTSFY